MIVRHAVEADVPAILAIINDAILNTTALFEYEPRTLDAQLHWLAAKIDDGWPVLVADDGEVAGYATFGTFRDRPAYDRTVEHSVYVDGARRGQGVGRRLLGALVEEAEQRGLHAMIGGIDGSNAASLGFHAALGFVEVGRLPQVGWKFGRWLDLVFMQRLLGEQA